MDFSKFIAVVFGIIFIVLLYFIIIYALKIMAKDVKSGGSAPTNTKSNSNANNRRPVPSKRRHHGIEIIEIGDNTALKAGSVIPIRDVTTIGRRSNNTIVLSDQYVSGNHAKIMVKNNALILEDLESTNGTFLNGQKISGRVKLFTKDQIAIGTAVFKVLS